MARRFHPFIAFAAVIAAAGSVTAAGLTFTAHTVAKTVAELPQVQARTLPSYVVRLPELKAADLDISKSIEVKPKTPVTVPAVPVLQAAVATPTTIEAIIATDPAPASVAEASPAASELYRVNSDVFVRSGPSKSYGQIGTVTGGTEVNVSGEDSGWLKVSFAGGSGWVYQQYLTPAAETVAEATTGAAPF